MIINKKFHRTKIVSGINVTRMTNLPGHYFFGFHDVCAWNHEGNKVAALRVNVIDRPPTGEDRAEAGYWDETTGEFVPLLETTAYNFPQGARQLWSPYGGFWVNVRIDDAWGAVRVDETGTVRQTVSRALYAISQDGSVGWGLNFSRLNRLGAYGYVGLPDRIADQAAPESDGIWEIDLTSGVDRLLVSIREVAAAAGGQIGQGHHYLTHLVPSPSNHRLLFLHRYWLGDGGLHHRLMSVRVDGSDLRCHGEGFLSHFDWRDDQRVIIWGRVGGSIDRLRSNPIMELPGVRPLARLAKPLLKIIAGKSSVLRMHFLEVDLESGLSTPVWPDILKEDGHPMFCPADREWMIVDTYPDVHGVRLLMLLNVATGKSLIIGRYSMLKAPVDTSLMHKTLADVDPRVISNVNMENLAFWRSGLHCDLHPRWKADGTFACFDSIHEGSRQMYRVDTSMIFT